MGLMPISVLLSFMSKKDQKIIPNRYHVVPRTLIFILHDEEILLLKGAENKKIWAGYYNGVGGHIERGESVIDAAKRELLEETGINTDLKLKSIIFIDVEENLGINLFVFVGQIMNNQIESGPEGELEWVNLSAIKNYPLVEDLYELIPKILSQGDKILYGNYSYHKEKLTMSFSD
ncbi:MAG TPA: NUDIX domain-containing protein [Anaerolineaceae bacterium]|nr:NUDIX domain-containing protein [Anaerolineaceae bacterium]